MFIRLILTLFTGLLALSALAIESEDYDYNYDYIVKELSQSRDKVFYDKDPFAMVKIHAGVAYTTAMVNIHDSALNNTGFLQGVEASLGIDLFSRYWAAEGTVRSYGKSRVEDGVYASLKEFDLKVVYRSTLNRFIGFNTGIGMTARYLLLEKFGTKERHTTPASLLQMGVETKLTKLINLGAQVSYRNSMIGETADKSGVGATIKLGSRF